MLSNILGEYAPQQCTYIYPHTNVKEFIDFCQKLTRFGEAGVYGFLAHLDSREAATLLTQSITTEARRQLIFRQFEGLFPMVEWFQLGIPQSWAWTLLAPFISTCPENQTRLIWQNFPTLLLLTNPILGTRVSRRTLLRGRISLLALALQQVPVSLLTLAPQQAPVSRLTLARAQSRLKRLLPASFLGSTRLQGSFSTSHPGQMTLLVQALAFPKHLKAAILPTQHPTAESLLVRFGHCHLLSRAAECCCSGMPREGRLDPTTATSLRLKPKPVVPGMSFGCLSSM